MKVAIMQPYLFPYIGYWQLIHSVDKFVIYDNIQFEKNGWIRRNKILVDGKEKLFTIPLSKGSDYSDVRDRKLADNYRDSVGKLLRMMHSSYKKAPFYEVVYPLLEECLMYQDTNLFNYIYQSVVKVCEYLEIDTEIIISSKIPINHDLKGKWRVMEICKYLQADTYINPSGGVSLYSKDEFAQNGLKLQFLQSNLTPYAQLSSEFVPRLSIIDLMMHLSKAELKEQLVDMVLD